jgi:hypothetical protein
MPRIGPSALPPADSLTPVCWLTSAWNPAPRSTRSWVSAGPDRAVSVPFEDLRLRRDRLAVAGHGRHDGFALARGRAGPFAGRELHRPGDGLLRPVAADRVADGQGPFRGDRRSAPKHRQDAQASDDEEPPGSATCTHRFIFLHSG